MFFGDGRLLGQALGRLGRQLCVQVLSDCGYLERASAYHCQVLADLIDIAGLLHAAAIWPPPEITGAIRRMRAWLGTVLAPDGTIPLLNDGHPVPAALLARLAPEPRRDQPLVLLADTGLVSAQLGGWQLLADIGAPCPDELPAHAHADTLGCVPHADGAPLLADTGTSTYRPVRSATTSGPPRRTARSRSTGPTRPRCGAGSAPDGARGCTATPPGQTRTRLHSGPRTTGSGGCRAVQCITGSGC